MVGTRSSIRVLNHFLLVIRPEPDALMCGMLLSPYLFMLTFKVSDYMLC